MDQAEETQMQIVALNDLASEEAQRQLASVPAQVALRLLSQHGRDLLRRTAELPDTEQGLLDTLAAYRYAVFSFVAAAEKLEMQADATACRPVRF